MRGDVVLPIELQDAVNAVVDSESLSLLPIERVELISPVLKIGG